MSMHGHTEDDGTYIQPRERGKEFEIEPVSEHVGRILARLESVLERMERDLVQAQKDLEQRRKSRDFYHQQVEHTRRTHRLVILAEEHEEELTKPRVMRGRPKSDFAL